MAVDQSKGIWLVVLLLVVAGVFVAMSFSKEKSPAAQMVKEDVLADKTPPAAAPIKQQHTLEDQAAVAAVKAKPAIVEAPKVITSRESYAIQVYSFKDKTRADAALDKLKSKGYKAYVMVSDLGARGIWYRVRVGSFSTETDARNVLDPIISEFKSGIIVTE